MAPQAKIEETVPETLPADFSEWDSGGPPATLPDNFNDFDAAPVASFAPAPPSKSVAPPAPVVQPMGSLAKATTSRAPVEVVAEVRELAELVQSRQGGFEEVQEREQEGKNKRKKAWMFAAAGSVPVLLLLILVPLNYRKAPPKTAAARQQAAQPTTTTLTIPPPELTTPAAVTTKPSPTTTLQPMATVEERPRPQVDSAMMNNQLNAAARISRDIKKPATDAPPPSGFGVAGMEGMGGNSGGAVGGVFSKQAGPKVQLATPKTVRISAGVAQGMLVARTMPAYPAIARSARVSGTVVLEVTILKTGAVTDIRAVSGPPMLRQAAIDAVHTWRYKPYMLDNEPVDVEATLNVNFVLGG
jgi:protein TonB